MEKLPHTYEVAVAAHTEGSVNITADGLPDLESAPPRQFGGPGDQWSPEDLLMASLSSCFVLSFRAIAAVNKMAWSDLTLSARGELDKVDRVTRFTTVAIEAQLLIDSSDDLALAEKLLGKAEASCFITNSLNCEIDLVCRVTTA